MSLVPTIGRVVLFKSIHPEQLGNGTDEVPAIITRVWSNNCVNLQVLRDAETPFFMTSVSMCDDFDGSGYSCAWRWMPYQKAVAAGGVEPLRHAAPADPPKADHVALLIQALDDDDEKAIKRHGVATLHLAFSYLGSISASLMLLANPPHEIEKGGG